LSTDRIKKIEEYEHLWALNPNEVTYLFEQAKLHALNSEEESKAIDLLKYVVKNDSKNVDAMTLLGLLYARSDQLSLAIEACDWVHNVNANPGNAIMYTYTLLEVEGS